jgi:hypothetical protein
MILSGSTTALSHHPPHPYTPENASALRTTWHLSEAVPRDLALADVSLRAVQRRGNLNDGYGIIVNLTIIHPGANAAITTLLTGENGKIKPPRSSGQALAWRSHEIT